MTLILILLIILIQPVNATFLQEQLKYERVRTAKAEKEEIVKNLFEKNGLNYPSDQIYIRIFKSEALLELWAFNKENGNYLLVKVYDICSLSGKLGPKRRRGDLQIPEGFYFISLFNPVSNFYLSLKINYPNQSDKILGYKKDLGGDIFIHGDCVTIGCIPITDNFIKEVYWIAVLAKENGQTEIPVHIFPAKLNDKKMTEFENNYKSNKELLIFWKSLKPLYEYFEKYKVLPEIFVDKSGKYQLKINR